MKEDLKSKRTRANLSQERLASMVGVSRAFISKLESGKATPTAELEERFARAFQEVMNKKGVSPGSTDSLTMQNKIVFTKSPSVPQMNEPAPPNALNVSTVTSDGTSWMDVLSWAWKWFIRMELSFFQELEEMDSPLSQMEFHTEADESGDGTKLTGSVSKLYLKLSLSSPEINHKTSDYIRWVIRRWFAKPDVVFRAESKAGETFSWVWFSTDASSTDKVKFVQSQAQQRNILEMEESLQAAWDRFVAFHGGRFKVGPM